MTMRATPATAARIAALSFVVLTIAATTIKLRHGEDDSTSGQSPRARAGYDAIRAELARCQQSGESGARDPACLHAWAENRRHFLKMIARPQANAPVEMFKAPETTPDSSTTPIAPKEP